jgi:hypothetical protein
VLRLEPCRFDAPLRGTFRYQDLLSISVEPLHESRDVSSRGSTAGSYEVISYAWGEVVYRHTFTVDSGHDIGLTDSLYQALLHLRGESGTRDLWADAICINQFDNTEKSVQVAGMAHIYRSASAVVV